MFFYNKVKGQVEEGCKGLSLPHLAIFKPGLLTGRDNDERILEQIGAKIPFIPKVDAK